jgi:hypothetical protein
VAGFCECGDEPSSSGAMELCAVLFFWLNRFKMAELQTCEVGAKPASVSLELSRVKKLSYVM